MALTLLIVDDDDVDRLAIRRVLREAQVDAHILEAATPEEAMAALSERVDCVLLDYHLPGSTGLELVSRFRERDETLPVIALTGQGDEQLAVALMKAGAVDYLSKQLLSPDRLERSIRHALGAAAAARERRALLRREQHAREEAEAANRAKDEFLATLSHELRTPLNAILGWARLLTSATPDAATVARGLHTIERNARLQVKLIDDLLDVSRIITGKLAIERGPVRFGSLVQTVVESLQPNAAAARVRLTCDVAGGQSEVAGDAARLQQIVSNLVTNAIKFTPAGGEVGVHVAFEGTEVVLSVSDTGEGIAPDFLPHVFERFSQADGGSTRRHGGLGLGLSIVRHLVELHGGSVAAHSDGVGRGARFVVRLPIVPLPDVTSGSADGPPAPTLSGLRVVLVDDDDDNRELLAAILGRHGADVRQAASARDGIALAEQCQPHVVLSDIAMPHEDGYGLVARLRSSAAAGVPVVAVTAFAGSEDRLRALSAGFCSHVPKPVEPQQLVDTVARVAVGIGQPLFLGGTTPD